MSGGECSVRDEETEGYISNLLRKVWRSANYQPVGQGLVLYAPYGPGMACIRPVPD